MKSEFCGLTQFKLTAVWLSGRGKGGKRKRETGSLKRLRAEMNLTVRHDIYVYTYICLISHIDNGPKRQMKANLAQRQLRQAALKQIAY